MTIGPLDHFIIALAIVVSPVVGFLRYRGLAERIRRGGSVARVTIYATSGTYQWLEVTALLLIWGLLGRDLTQMGFAWPGTVYTWAGLAVSLILSGVYVWQLQISRGDAEARRQIRKVLAKIEWILPHDMTELRAFIARAVTAGIAEEIVWRGFLLWYLGQILGGWQAVVVALVAFAVAHAYQGFAGAAKAGAAGVICWGLYAVSGSLIPAMIFHVAIDVFSGSIAAVAFARAEEDERAAAEEKAQLGATADPAAATAS
ncbi:MAG: hypothetical protein AMXMBFR47_03530 [Planctomycetota bacterium]